MGTSTTFTNATTGGIWSIEPPGTISASITSEGLVTGLSTGTVTVVYTYFNGICSNRATTSLIVSPSMVINDATVYSNSPVSNPLCPGEALVLTSPEGGTWYDWYDPNGDWISSDRITTLPDIQYSERGLYTVYIYNACYQFGFPKSIEVSLHQRPAPTITGSESVCLNSTHTYTTETGNGINSYAWSVTGGTYTGGTSTDNTVTVTWDNVGEGTVSVNYLDGNGCTAKDPTILNVTVNSLPVPTITGLQSVCFNSTTTYTTQSGGGIKEYVWKVIGGTYTGGASTDNTVTVTWNATGAKSVSVNYTDINGCTAPAAAVYPVTVNQLPEPVISGPVTACQNVPGIVYSTLAGMEDYQWVIDGGTITSALPMTNTVTVTWQTLGAKNISVNFRDGNGCYAAAPTVYNVTVYPIPPLPVISGSSIVCQGNPGQIYTIGTGLPGYIYNWSISGGNIDSGTGTNSISVTWTSTGAHSISVYSTSNGCNSPTATYNVTVNTTPVQPSIITGTSTVCAGTTTPVSYSVTADPGVTKYVWSYSGTGVSFYSGENTNSMSVIYSPTATSGTWTVTPWNDCGAGSTPRTLAIAVNPLPGLITSMNGKTEQCATVYGEIYSISTDPDATSYSWTVPTGWSITSGQGTISITVVTGPTGANGNVTVTPKNACGSGTPYSTAVTVNLSAPAAPLDITGPATVCAGKTDVEYSTALVNGVTSWTWTVPEGWLITSGQTGDIGTAIIKVTAGNVGQGGIISVVANNGCRSSRTTINIKPLSSERSTGYVTSTGSIFGGEIRSSNNNPLGFVKFPLSAIPAGATIIGSTLSLTNNANLTPSDFINNKVTNIADYDPATISSGSLLHTAIINGISFNTSYWINTGTFSLSLNKSATDSIQSRLESPGYIGMGLVREGASYWKFYGYGSVNAPNLEVTYKDAAIKAVTINALPVAIAASESSSLCAGSNLQLYAGGGVSYSWVGPELTEPIFRSTERDPLRTNTPTTGSGLYTVTVTDANGCSSNATTRVSVNASAITIPGSIVYGASNASALPLSASANCTSIEEIGPSNASTGADNGSNGQGDNWNNPGNITSAGSPYTDVSLDRVRNNVTQVSTYLQGSGYGFEIPAGATIQGITVVINRMSDHSATRDDRISLVKGSSVQTANKFSASDWPVNTFSTATYGGPGDLWGTTWSASDINNSGFGVVLSVRNSNNNSRANPEVDYMQITVTCEINGTLQWYTSVDSPSPIFSSNPFNPVAVPASGIDRFSLPNTYTFWASCSNLTGCLAPAVFEIKKAEQTITWNNPADIVYGTALDGTQLNAIVAGVAGGSSVTGAVTYTPALGTIMNAGNAQDLKIDVAATAYYNATSKTVKINVLKADQTITVVTPSPATAIYNTSFTVAAISSSGLPVAYTSTAPLGNVGALYTMNSGIGTGVVKYNQAGDDNYNAAPEVTANVDAVKADQSITVVTPSPATAAYNTSFTVAATATSGLPVTYTSTAPLSNVNGLYTMNSGTGTGVVRYNQTGDDNYNAAPEVTASVDAVKADQSITVVIPSPATAAYNTSFTVAATATSGLPVAYTSTAPLGNVGALYTMNSGIGTGVVKYNQAGDDNYNAAPEVTANVDAVKADQSITVVTPSPATAAYNTSFTVAATATSGLPVTYTSTAPLSNVNGLYTMNSGIGTGVVKYNQAGDDNYNAAPEVTANVDAAKLDQTITIVTPSPATAVYNTSFTVAAISSSGLPVAYTSTAPLGNVGALYTMNSGTGTGVVRYNQTGDDNYNAAPEVTASVDAVKADQSITVVTPSPATAAYNTSFTVAATATSGLPVAYTSTAPLGNVGALYTMNSGIGTGVVKYNQAGDDNYNAAPEVTANVDAVKADQSITVVTPSPATAAYNTSFTVAATATSGLPVAYTSTAPLGNVGALYTMNSGIGTGVVKYNQAGDDNYNAAPEVTANVDAVKADQSITVVTPSPATAAYNTSFTVAATATSGLPVTYTSTAPLSNVNGLYTMNSGIGTEWLNTIRLVMTIIMQHQR